MFLNLWLIFMFTGLTATLFIFIWAVRNGQFDNPKRASALPIEKNEINLVAPAKLILHKEQISLLVFVGIGVLALVFTTIVALTN